MATDLPPDAVDAVVREAIDPNANAQALIGHWVVGPHWVARLAEADATVFALLDCPPQFETELEARRQLDVQLLSDQLRLYEVIRANRDRIAELETK